jgi:hypothetical protein
VQLSPWLRSDVRQTKKPIKTTMVTTILAKTLSLTIDRLTNWNKPIVRHSAANCQSGKSARAKAAREGLAIVLLVGYCYTVARAEG